MSSTIFNTLIITGGLAPEVFDYDIHYHKIVAADSGYDTAMRLGIKIDEAVGDFDSTAHRSELISLGYKPCSRDKDETDTELAIRSKLYGIYDLLGGGGGRIDHLFSILALFRVYGLPRYWFTDSDVLLGFKGKGYIDGNIDDDLSILPLNDRALVKSNGLLWELGDRPLTGTFLSQSNRLKANRAYIETDAPVLIRVAPSAFRPGMLSLL